MGTVIDLAAWRNEHEPEMLRLERAVSRLDRALAGVDRARAPAWLVTGVLAIQGCISMDLLAEAASRTERLVERWSRHLAGRRDAS